MSITSATSSIPSSLNNAVLQSGSSDLYSINPITPILDAKYAFSISVDIQTTITDKTGTTSSNT